MAGLSLCQLIADADCMQALAEDRCPNDGSSSEGCKGCLHYQRFERNDANWLPEGKDISDFPEACRLVETAGEENGLWM